MGKRTRSSDDTGNDTSEPSNPPKNQYLVGKNRPDPRYQWQKGESGNRKGRPKGSKNLRTIIRQSAKRLVPVRQGGRTRKKTYPEICIHQIEKAVGAGDRWAILAYLSIIERFEENEDRGKSSQELQREDQAILDYFLDRLTRKKNGPKR